VTVSGQGQVAEEPRCGRLARRRVAAYAQEHDGRTSRRGRIAIVTVALFAGGTERHILRLAIGLREAGWDVVVYCLWKEGSFIPRFVGAGIPVFGSHQKPSKTPHYLVGALRELTGFLRHRQPDIAHCYLTMPGAVGALAARLASVPVVITTRRNVLAFRGRARIQNRAVMAVSDRLSDRVVAVCETAADHARAEGTPSRKVVVIPNGVETHPTRQRRGLFGDASPIFGTVAALLPKKGHVFLVDAIPVVSESCPGALFVLVGDGPERPALELRAQQLGVAERLLFLGVRDDVEEILAELDAFVLPSLYEGLPNSVLEAMAAGVPVIATRVGGVPEIVQDGVSGLLAEPASPPALAAAMVRLARDEGLRRRLAENALAFVATRSVGAEIDATIALYQSLMGGDSLRRKGEPGRLRSI
jgi:glycosyltransferase involved in cell wall biosynthesis